MASRAPARAITHGAFDPGTFLCCHAISFGIWIVVGALTHADPSAAAPYDGTIVLVIFLLLAFFIFLIVAQVEYTYNPSPPPAAATFTAAVLGLSTTTAYCIFTSDRRNVIQHAFLVMGSVYAGGAVEVATGLVTKCLRRMEASNRIGHGVGEKVGVGSA